MNSTLMLPLYCYLQQNDSCVRVTPADTFSAICRGDCGGKHSPTSQCFGRFYADANAFLMKRFPPTTEQHSLTEPCCRASGYSHATFPNSFPHRRRDEQAEVTCWPQQDERRTNNSIKSATSFSTKHVAVFKRNKNVSRDTSEMLTGWQNNRCNYIFKTLHYAAFKQSAVQFPSNLQNPQRGKVLKVTQNCTYLLHTVLRDTVRIFTRYRDTVRKTPLRSPRVYSIQVCNQHAHSKCWKHTSRLRRSGRKQHMRKLFMLSYSGEAKIKVGRKPRRNSTRAFLLDIANRSADEVQSPKQESLAA